MKIYVFNVRKLILFALLSAAVVFLFFEGINITNSIAAFSESKELPIYSVEADSKKVSITFDCAWGNGDIPSILKTLSDGNVKATFFIVGQWAEKYPGSVRAIAAAGHDVANHSYSHLRMGTLGRAKIREEITACSNKLGELSGRKVDLFRAPYGDYSNSVVTTARDMGYYTVQWDVDSLDWKPDIGSSEILQRITAKVQPGSIILLHNDTNNTAKVLPEIIKALKSNGYELVPVSELILRSGFTIDHMGKQKKK